MFAKPHNERLYKSKEDPLRIEFLESNNDLIYCDFVKIRTKHGPGRGGENTEVVGFDWKSDEGFGEETAMLIDLNRKIAIAQYNHHGPRINAIEDYINHWGHNDQNLHVKFAPKLDPTIEDKINTFTIVKQASFTVAVEKMSEAESEAGGSVINAAYQAARLTQGDTVTIEISAGRSKNKILDLKLRDVCNWLKNIHASEGKESSIKSATVKACQDQQSSIELLDLLEHKLMTEKEIAPGTDKRYPRNARWESLRLAHSDWIHYFE